MMMPLRLLTQLLMLLLLVLLQFAATKASSTVAPPLVNYMIKAEFSNRSISLTVGATARITVRLTRPFVEGAYLYFTYQADPKSPVLSAQERQVLRPLPAIYLATNVTQFDVNFTAWDAGRVIVGINSSSGEFLNNHSEFVRVTVAKSAFIDDVNFVVGILYVILWSVSFYPQTWLNFRRKSVVGLNFDFISLNLLGFCAYTAFNVCLYWVPAVQSLYALKHPRGVIPVEISDVIFAIHAACITFLQVIQCCLYERGGQRISVVGRLLLVGMILFLSIGLLVSVFWQAGFDWLSYLYCVSYVKLAVTLVKYSPQAYMNYRRKSTDGWSIGQIFTDFSGGALSILQMLLLAYNYNDWLSIMGDPTKFGLGAVSIIYDCVFFVQHYALYGEPARLRHQRRQLAQSNAVAVDASTVNQRPAVGVERLENGNADDDDRPLLG